MNKTLIIVLIYSISSLYSVDKRTINSSIKTAKMLEKKNDVESAISIYKSLLLKDPSNKVAIRNIKSIYKKQKLYSEGISFIKTRINKYSNDFNNYIYLGELYYLNKQDVEAISLWRASIEKFKNQRPFYRLMLSTYFRLNLDSEIELLLNSGRNQFGQSFLSYELGTYYQSRSDFDKAMDQFLINLLNDPHQNNVIERRILMMSDDETSLSIIEKKLIDAEKKDPKIALNILSEFYFKQQNYQKSYDSKLKWSNHFENSINSWFKFAEQLREEKQSELSINAYNYILSHKLHGNLIGKALYGLAKTFESQIVPYEKINLIPYFFDNNIFFHNPFIEVPEFSHENLKLSLKIYDSLLVTLPNSHLSSEVYFSLGEIQYRILNDFDQSLNFLNKALQHNPKEKLKIKIFERIADVMISKGLSDEVIAFLDRKLNFQDSHKLNMKKILVYFLYEPPNVTLTKINDLIIGLNPLNQDFNDLMELKNILIQGSKGDSTNINAFNKFIKSEQYLRQQKVASAISELNYINKEYPNSPLIPLINLRASLLYYRLGRYEQSLKIAQGLENSIYADRGIILTGQIYEYELKNFKEAESQYLRIINEHPSSVFSEPIRFHIRRLEKKNL
ncbi:MAG: hypothetical protein CMC66_05185 [Flavobacteriaceae bacterium]|nr:hypothetical protein [Flavobacteriaceae bacterium]